jgi:hypothetical protein
MWPQRETEWLFFAAVAVVCGEQRGRGAIDVVVVVVLSHETRAMRADA